MAENILHKCKSSRHKRISSQPRTFNFHRISRPQTNKEERSRLRAYYSVKFKARFCRLLNSLLEWIASAVAHLRVQARRSIFGILWKSKSNLCRFIRFLLFFARLNDAAAAVWLSPPGYIRLIPSLARLLNNTLRIIGFSAWLASLHTTITDR